MTIKITDEMVHVALLALAQANIPPDLQEVLLRGNPDRGIAPGALHKLLEAAFAMLPEPACGCREASNKLGAWMAAALDDPNVCAEMKADIIAWFAALASPECGVREGWVLVPKEPTEAMLGAANRIWSAGSYAIWTAMIAAAPPAAQKGEG